ncbi:MAG: hypothetical protein GXO45_00105 [Aquificae bacterium]|nr:hypothetical protein [Aquificota bacterium]
MEMLTYSPVIYSKEGFPRDNGKPYLPKETFLEAITSAVIFYYTKKDKEIENRIKKYLLSEGVRIEEVSETVKQIVLDKYPILDDLQLPEKVYLPQESIKQEYVEVFDLREWIDTDGFKTEAFFGSVDINIQSPHIEKLKAVCHSYVEALLRIEHSFLKEHYLAKLFYEPLMNEVKKWDMPLRIGMWTGVSFKGDLLFFWRIKEVREYLIKKLHIDIRPRYILYIPRRKETTGWVNIKIK